MANTNEQMAAEALIMLQAKPQQKKIFNIPVLKNMHVPHVPQSPVPPIPTSVKRKRAYRAPSSPIPRSKGRFAKKESLFVPKPPKKAYTGTKIK